MLEKSCKEKYYWFYFHLPLLTFLFSFDFSLHIRKKDLEPFCHTSKNTVKLSKKFSFDRAYSSSLLRAIIARNHLPFFKIFSNFVHFCPNLQIFCPFLPFFCSFFAFFLKNHTHVLTL